MKRFFISLMAFIVAVSCTESIDEHSITGGIAGVVADKTTGEPVPTVNVKLQETGNSTVTGSDGSFLFNNLEEGQYTVLLSKEGYKDNSNLVQVSGGKTIESHLLIERIPAVLTIDRDILDFGDNYSNNTLSFSMVNKNYVDLDWEIVYSCRWIKQVDPEKSVIKLGFGKTQTVVVIIDRDALQPGNNETTLVVRTSDGSSELLIKAVGHEKRLASLNVKETSDIKATSAILNGEITDKGIPEYTERGFVLGDSEMPTKETAIKVIPAAVDAEMGFSARAGELIVGRTYYVRAYATNSIGTGYSTNQTKFTTVAILPTVETLPASNDDRETKTAVLKGRITYEGDPAYTERGFVWSSVYQNPTIEEDKIVVNGSGSGEFEKRMTFQKIDQTIYVRAYATNQRGTAYGETVEVFPLEYIVLNTLKLGVHKTDLNSTNLSWDVANSMCKNSSVAGLHDWRLPTKNELLQLYAMKDEIGGFNSNKYSYYWSSTWGYGSDYGSYYDGYVRVHFYDGTAGTTVGSSNPTKRARCVRTL